MKVKTNNEHIDLGEYKQTNAVKNENIISLINRFLTCQVLFAMQYWESCVCFFSLLTTRTESLFDDTLKIESSVCKCVGISGNEVENQ